jgi:hypothetical protein
MISIFLGLLMKIGGGTLSVATGMTSIILGLLTNFILYYVAYCPNHQSLEQTQLVVERPVAMDHEEDAQEQEAAARWEDPAAPPAEAAARQEQREREQRERQAELEARQQVAWVRPEHPPRNTYEAMQHWVTFQEATKRVFLTEDHKRYTDFLLLYIDPHGDYFDRDQYNAYIEGSPDPTGPPPATSVREAFFRWQDLNSTLYARRGTSWNAEDRRELAALKPFLEGGEHFNMNERIEAEREFTRNGGQIIGKCFSQMSPEERSRWWDVSMIPSAFTFIPAASVREAFFRWQAVMRRYLARPHMDGAPYNEDEQRELDSLKSFRENGEHFNMNERIEAEREFTRNGGQIIGKCFSRMSPEERAAQERAAQERAAQERAAQERAAQERAAQERAARLSPPARQPLAGWYESYRTGSPDQPPPNPKHSLKICNMAKYGIDVLRARLEYLNRVPSDHLIYDQTLEKTALENEIMRR